MTKEKRPYGFRVVPDGEGGISVEIYEGEKFTKININADWSVDVINFKNYNIISRTDIPDGREGGEWSALDEEKKANALFCELQERWHEETKHLSSITETCMHPDYQKIIGMGPVVLPVILKHLAQKPDHWFWALTAITRENPVKYEHRGNLKKMTDDWLEWGIEKGIFSVPKQAHNGQDGDNEKSGR